MKINLSVKLTFLLLILSIFSNAQKTIAVQSNGTASFFIDWAQAWQNTNAGDTIYLPGGTFNIGNLDIDKVVTIIGVGHDTAYIHDRLFSHLNGTIRLLDGSDSTLLHGFLLGNLQIGTADANDNVENINISRCRIGTLKLGFNNPSPAKDILFTESVIAGIMDGMNAKHVQFNKNIFDGVVCNFNGSTVFSNNIFTYGHTANYVGYFPLESISFSFFNNNIFKVGFYPFKTTTIPSQNNLMENNIFAANITINPQTDLNVWNNNFFNQPLPDVFVGYTTGGFQSTNDYHLKTGSVGISAGTDGYDIGIYGTAIPFKEGAAPFNPRIVQETISKQTDENGRININVQVEAQQH